jgi:hypothetical protein
MGATRAKSSLLGSSQPGTKHHVAFEHDDGEYGCVSGRGGSHYFAVFEAYVERILLPTLCPWQVVVMDDLTAHKGERVTELIEERGCEP